MDNAEVWFLRPNAESAELLDSFFCTLISYSERNGDMKKSKRPDKKSVIITPDYSPIEISVIDARNLVKIREILARGNNAEVKQTSNGDWVVYEVSKKIK